MSDEHQNKGTRWLWVIAKVYAGMCTVFVTLLLLLWLWSYLFENPTPAPPPNLRTLFLTSYGVYMAEEYPKRGDKFWSMIGPLRQYISQSPIPQGDLFRYLGKPDQFVATNVISSAPDGSSITGRVMAVKYLIQRAGATNTLAAVAQIADGMTYDIAARDARDYDQPRFQDYSGEASPNPQAGADRVQPLEARPNPSPGPAAPGRSP